MKSTNFLSKTASSTCLLACTLFGVAACGASASPTPTPEDTNATASEPLSVSSPQILWWNTSNGALQVWNVPLTGAGRTSFANFPSSLGQDMSGSRVPVGIADFNGDGQDDLLLEENESGALQVWYLNGVNQIGVGNLGAGLNVFPPTTWVLVAIADFNGDGHPDLLWHNRTSGALQAWYMNGITRIGFANLSAELNTPDSTGWFFHGAADFNGDGHPDILALNNDSGALRVWYMNGVTRTGSQDFASDLTVPTNKGWGIAGIGDYNGDGKPDLLFWESFSGALQIWYLNGINRTGFSNFPASLEVSQSTGWAIVDPTNFVAQ